jgi:hypothetical protein
LPSKGLLAFDVLRSKVFWQTWSLFFRRHGSLLAFDVLRSKGLLADVELVLLAFDVLRSKGLLADVEPVFRAW